MYNGKGVFRKEDFMLIDLNEILVEAGKDKTIEDSVSLKSLDIGYANYDFKEDINNTYSVTFKHKGNKKLVIDYEINATLLIPCDRCLELVDVPICASGSKDLDLKKYSDDKELSSKRGSKVTEYDEDEELEEFEFLNGSDFDLDVFLKNEILLDLPMKTLCKEDCKGICNKCGINLNNGSCGCDTTELDPRMSKILDVFNQFKEV